MIARSAVIGVLLVACAAPSKPGPPPRDPLGKDALMAHVTALVDPRLDGREAGTEGERAAVRYVAGELRRIGAPPTEQPVPYMGGSTNVYTLVRGTGNDAIVVGAHLDHLGRKDGVLYPGADDNASGVALVLGIAEVIAARREPLGRSIVFVWFGAEEPGMVGSRHFVDHPPVPLAQIAAMVNVDMIGRPLLDQPLFAPALDTIGIDPRRSVGLVGARRFPGLRAVADAAFRAGDGHVIAPEDLPALISGIVERQTAGRGDSVSFEARGIPALFFGDGESSDYHQPTDTIDRLDPALLERRARAIARVVVDLADAAPLTFAPTDERSR